jgi:DNA-binding NarL/FixJ family response regulator
MKTVVIVEDQTAVREMIGQVVDSDPTLSVIAQTGDGNEAYEICLKQKPDLVILDLMLVGMSGAELMKKFSKQLPNSRVLVFSGYQTPVLVRELMQAGAHGYVEKTAALVELKKAIQTVAAGGNYFGPEVTKIVHQTLVNPVAAPAKSLESLTTREKEILTMVTLGHTNKEMSAKLNVSVKTVENHRANLMRKLDIHNAAGLARFAVEKGLVEGK